MNPTLKVPSFYKNDISEAYLGIISKDRLIKICNLSFTGTYRTVQVLESDQKIIDNCMPFVHEISESEFYKAYNRCLQDITKDVACATA
jgi:hypothetical protein